MDLTLEYHELPINHRKVVTDEKDNSRIEV